MSSREFNRKNQITIRSGFDRQKSPGIDTIRFDLSHGNLETISALQRSSLFLPSCPKNTFRNDAIVCTRARERRSTIERVYARAPPFLRRAETLYVTVRRRRRRKTTLMPMVYPTTLRCLARQFTSAVARKSSRGEGRKDTEPPAEVTSSPRSPAPCNARPASRRWSGPITGPRDKFTSASISPGRTRGLSFVFGRDRGAIARYIERRDAVTRQTRGDDRAIVWFIPFFFFFLFVFCDSRARWSSDLCEMSDSARFSECRVSRLKILKTSVKAARRRLVADSRNKILLP